MFYKRRIERPESVSRFSSPVFEDSLSLSQRLEDIERDAYERGFNQGKQAGLEMAEREAALIIMKEIEADPEIVLRLTEEATPGLLRLHQDIVIDIDPSIPPYGSEIVSETQAIITDIDEQIKTLIKDIAERL